MLRRSDKLKLLFDLRMMVKEMMYEGRRGIPEMEKRRASYNVSYARQAIRLQVINMYGYYL